MSSHTSRQINRGSGPSRLVTNKDARRFGDGKHTGLYQVLGAHVRKGGVDFAVWAPNAQSVSVIGSFNRWSSAANGLELHDESGIWYGHVADAKAGDRYKFSIRPKGSRKRLEKADPFAFACERQPGTASRIWDLSYKWGDAKWMANRTSRNALDAPISIYEVHLGSWRWSAQGRPLTYRELAQELPGYLNDMYYTHVEFLPVMEHPFTGSWGYQVTGYYAPTSRFGSPQDFMHLIDELHQAGLGVILDWVPSHFPIDEHALARFDGTPLYEHPDPRRGFQPDWNTFVFDYGVPEVRSFLKSSAVFWLDTYHVDGLRVDAVASMLYLDFSRGPGEWLPNRFGGNENLEAVEFLQELNSEIRSRFPDVQMMAEESTAWPRVSRPVAQGGLGFGLKWDLGWMNDTLKFMRTEPAKRSRKRELLTFRSVYAFHENFLLPLSHDEVVYGKGSLIGKMPGESREAFANLRLLLGYMMTLPGKKLLFMGSEFGQLREWNHDRELDWELLEEPGHSGLVRWVRDLNSLYTNSPALHELEFDPAGFEWTGMSSVTGSKLSFRRVSASRDQVMLAVFNFSSRTRNRFAVQVPDQSVWEERLNSDDTRYEGKGRLNPGPLVAGRTGRPGWLELVLPEFCAVILEQRPGV